ncbi:unnamed protein product [Sphagnum balticum]
MYYSSRSTNPNKSATRVVRSHQHEISAAFHDYRRIKFTQAEIDAATPKTIVRLGAFDVSNTMEITQGKRVDAQVGRMEIHADYDPGRQWRPIGGVFERAYGRDRCDVVRIANVRRRIDAGRVHRCRVLPAVDSGTYLIVHRAHFRIVHANIITVD